VTTIVVVFGSNVGAGQASTLASEKSTLESLLDEATGRVDVSILSLGMQRTVEGLASSVELGAAPKPVADRLLAAFGAYALRSRLAKIPIGRLINSLGPVDQGRVFWRAVRRSPEAVALLRSADVIIAADAPAVRTAWVAVRRGYCSDAFYDHRSAAVGSGFSLERGA